MTSVPTHVHDPLHEVAQRHQLSSSSGVSSAAAVCGYIMCTYHVHLWDLQALSAEKAQADGSDLSPEPRPATIKETCHDT